jgi:hypothetical protein
MNMNPLSNSVIAILALSIFISSCSGGKEAVEKTEVKSKALFLENEGYNKDETYRSIKGSVKRLHAMMSGRFVQYTTGANPKGGKYKTWLINDGQDSVIIYHIPIGNPDKEGYWMYNCQVMTSLPNDPLYATISKLEEVDRDTINAVYYDFPPNFNVSLPEILEDPKSAFASVRLLSLKKAEGEGIPYVRESLTNYKGEDKWAPDDYEGNEGGFVATYFLVRPQMMVFGSNTYDKDKKNLKQTNGERLMKNAMINPDYSK